MGEDPCRATGNPHQEGLPLDLEGNTSLSVVTRVVLAGTRGSTSGAEPSRVGSYLRSSCSEMLFVQDLHSSQGAHWFEAYSRRICSERVHLGPIVHNVEPLYPEAAFSCSSLDASLDLKDAYLHVPIRQNLHKFLALSCWGRLFFFRALPSGLPFGLAPAPRLFSMLMEAVLTCLRQGGVDILGYLDDLVLWNPCRPELITQVRRTVTLLERLGLAINRKKSSPSPSLSLT